jgi:YD repeat-containing protein
MVPATPLTVVTTTITTKMSFKLQPTTMNNAFNPRGMCVVMSHAWSTMKRDASRLRIQNYVKQGESEPEDWGWNDTLSQWEDGANNPIDHGTDLDVNRIQSTEFDRAGRVISTRDTVGRVQYHVYDVMGRRTLSVQNYVVQGVSTPDAWLWDEAQARWEDGAGNAIEHGTDNDQNLIMQTSYNIAGQVVATRDTRGTRTDYIYDDAGRRVSVVQAVGTKLASQSYTCYDKAGRVRRTIANYVANGNDPDAWQTDAVETWLFVQSTMAFTAKTISLP